MGDVPRSNADLAQQSSPNRGINARDAFKLACQAFEQGWIAGKRPRIEDCLVELTEPLRTNLFRELVALEVEHRFGRGEEPNLNEYNSRFPQDGIVLAEVFSRRQPPSDQSPEMGHSSEENSTGSEQGDDALGTVIVDMTDINSSKNVISDARQNSSDVVAQPHSSQENPTGSEQEDDALGTVIVDMTDVNSSKNVISDAQQNSSDVVGQPHSLSDQSEEKAHSTEENPTGTEQEDDALGTVIVDLSDANPIKNVISDVGQNRSDVVGQSHSSEKNTTGTEQGDDYLGTVIVEQSDIDDLKNVISEGQSDKIRDSVQRGKSGSVKTQLDSKTSETHYEMLENFARGGMGNIWRSRDTRIRREVAYKELLPKSLKSKDIVERFVQEAQVTGQLEHPGIVPIYDLGWQENGTPYYTMKLVRGHTLNESMRDYHGLPENHSEKRIKFIKLLQNFIAVCNALAFAHDRGVLHRDLKPDNIMLGDFGETLVLDWGLAKLIEVPSEDAEMPGDDGPSNIAARSAVKIQPTDVNFALKDTFISDNDTNNEKDSAAAKSSKSGMSSGASSRSISRDSNIVSTNARSAQSYTSFGSIMGTIAYLSPEQALGQIDELDSRSDIYCLGTILYEILTGERVVGKEAVPNMIRKVVVEIPKEPRELNRTVPKSLNAICMKALQKIPARRYQKTLEFSQDLEAYLADEPVSAYAEPWHVRAGRWCRRHRTAVWSTVTSLVVIAVGIASWNVVEDIRIEKIRSRSNATIASAQSLIQDEDYDKAKALLISVAGVVENEPALNDLELSVRRQLENADRLRLGALRSNVESLIASAETATQQQNYEEARRKLETATTKLGATTELANETGLADLRATVKTRLEEVINYLNIQEAQDAAKVTFEEFQKHADWARFYGSLFTGESVDEDSAEARKFALQALKLYGFDESVPVDVSPEYLSVEKVQILKTDAFELMLIVAESTVTLARHAGSDEKQTAAGLALERIQKAKRFEIPCKTALLREADYLGRLGKTDEQNAVKKQALQTEPVIALDYFLLAETQRKQQNFEQALPLYLDALRIDPDHFWSIHFRGLCHLQRDRPAAAEEAYSACIALRPRFPWNFLVRGVAFSNMGQFENAYADFEKAIQLEPGLMGIYVNRGATYIQQANYEAAIADFKHAAKLRKDRADPLINLAEAYRLQEQYESSLLALTKAEAIAPNNPGIFRIRGDIRRRMGQLVPAQKDFLKATTLDVLPHHIAGSYEKIGRIYNENGKWSDAIDAYNKAIQAAPNNAAVYELRAEVYLRVGREDDAISDYTKYLQLTTPTIEIYQARGLARAKVGRYHEAMNDFARVLESHDSPNILTRRGWAYLLRANSLALKDFDKAIQLNPENSDSYNGRGYAKVMLNDYLGACADAEIAVEKAQKQIALEGSSAWSLVFNAATIFAQSVDRVEKDFKKDKPEREKLAGQYTKRAVELILKAVQIAQRTHRSAVVHNIKTDSALDPIRNRPEFQQASESWLSPSRPETSDPKSDSTP